MPTKTVAASTSPKSLQLRFGTEIEVILETQTKHKEWEGAALEVCEALRASGLEVCIKDDGIDAEYTQWTIAREDSIPDAPYANRRAMELISPVFTFSALPDWTSDIETIWKVLNKKFRCVPSKDCSTHVHVSPVSGTWTPDHTRKIAKWMLYFERCVDLIMHPDRCNQFWCQSNRRVGASLAEGFTALDEAQDVDGLMRLLARSYNLRWNFMHISSWTGSIEFRQPPGSKNARDTRIWVLLEIAYLRAAVAYADEVDISKAPNLEDLRVFVLKGAKMADITDKMLVLLDNKCLQLYEYDSDSEEDEDDARTSITPDLDSLTPRLTLDLNDEEVIKCLARQSYLSLVLETLRAIWSKISRPWVWPLYTIVVMLSMVNLSLYYLVTISSGGA